MRIHINFGNRIGKQFFWSILSVFAILILLGSCQKEQLPGENEFMDERDDRIYKTVQIGDQIWMAENLVYLPQVDPPTADSDKNSHYYVYDYQGSDISKAKNKSNYSIYGVLYNWSAANISCPSGWHLPSDDEWKNLEAFMGMDLAVYDESAYNESGEVGKKLKSTSGWLDNGNGMNSNGFDAKPGGRKVARYNEFWDLGVEVSFWTSTPDSGSNSILRYITGVDIGVYRSTGYKSNGQSVRCLKD